MKKIIKNSSKQNKKEKIQTIIFSRDRAIQLDGLLRSFFLHCHDAHRSQITVIYKATNEAHARQYQTLSDEYAGHVSFQSQKHFRRDLLAILNPYKEMVFAVLFSIGNMGFPSGSFFERVWRRTIAQVYIFLISNFAPAIPKESYTLFLVDDNIFVRDFLLADIVDALRMENDLIGVSLRVGENTIYCYSKNQSQSLPEFIPIKLGLAKYDWVKSEYDFGYPLELSSSLYRLKNIFPLLLSISFTNPNTLEERMAFYAYKFSSKYPFLGCYYLSVTFCNPINMVQNIIPNRAGQEIRYTVNDLSTYFDRGERINVEAYSGFIPNSCHQEVELVFLKKLD